MGEDARSRCRAMRRLIATIASAAALLAEPAAAAENLNSDFEDICKSFRELNTELGASASPGSPVAGTMQKELSLSAAQYGALWSLLKLTPTPSCSRMY